MIVCLCVAVSSLVIGLMHPPYISTHEISRPTDGIITVQPKPQSKTVSAGTYYCVASNSITLDNEFTLESFATQVPYIQTDRQGNIEYHFLTTTASSVVLQDDNTLTMQDAGTAILLAFGILYHDNPTADSVTMAYDPDAQLIIVSHNDIITYFKHFQSDEQLQSWLSSYWTQETMRMPHDMSMYTTPTT